MKEILSLVLDGLGLLLLLGGCCHVLFMDESSMMLLLSAHSQSQSSPAYPSLTRFCKPSRVLYLPIRTPIPQTNAINTNTKPIHQHKQADPPYGASASTLKMTWYNPSFQRTFCLNFQFFFPAIFWISIFSFFFLPNIGMRRLPNILPSVKFPNFGNASCFSCFSCFSCEKKEEKFGR